MLYLSCFSRRDVVANFHFPRYFRDQPLLHPDVTDEILLVWYFEDWLKKYFFSVLQILEVWLATSYRSSFIIEFRFPDAFLGPSSLRPNTNDQLDFHTPPR